MKYIRMLLVALCALLGAQAAIAACTNLGSNPWRGTDAQAFKLLGLSQEAVVQLKATKPIQLIIDEGIPIKSMVFGEGQVKQDVRVCGQESADVYVLDGGDLVVVRPHKCGNWSIYNGRFTVDKTIVSPPPVKFTPAPPVPAAVPTQVPAPPPAVIGAREFSDARPTGHPDASVALYATDSKTSRNSGAYGEVMYWEDGKGVGVIGSWSEGNSKMSPSEWVIHMLGIQAGVQWKDKLPDGEVAKSQLKVRLGYETLHGSNSRSRFEKTQKTLLGGAYFERLNTDGDCLYGWTGEIWIPLGKADVSSNRRGVLEEDRTSASVNILRECPISENVSWRLSAGPGWSATGEWVLNGGAQLRFRLSSGVLFRLGPGVGLSLENGTFVWKFTVGFEFGEYVRAGYRSQATAAVMPIGGTVGQVVAGTPASTQPVASAPMAVASTRTVVPGTSNRPPITPEEFDRIMKAAAKSLIR